MGKTIAAAFDRSGLQISPGPARVIPVGHVQYRLPVPGTVWRGKGTCRAQAGDGLPSSV